MKLFIVIGLCYVAIAVGAETEQRLTVSGRIICCYKEITGPPTCSVIRHAKIELMNEESSLLPDQLLYTYEAHDTTTYVFMWSGKSLFKLKPYLNVHAECDDGIKMDKKYFLGEFVTDGEKNVLQNIRIDIQM